jgi:histidine ammonia-lyase
VSQPGTVRLRAAVDIDRRTILRVAVDGALLQLSDELLAHVAGSRRACLAALADGGPVYGVSTGLGFHADVDLDADDRAQLQTNLLLGRAVGGPPYLDRTEARAIVVARLTNLVSGHAGVSPELCRALVHWLNDGYAPAVPAEGVGTAGEIQPLAHAFQALLGVGRVLAPDGTVVEADRSLTDRGVAPYAPGPKEGIALLAGAPAAAGLGALAVDRVSRLADSLAVVSAAGLDAAGIAGQIHGVGPARLAGDQLHAEVLATQRSLRGLPDTGRTTSAMARVAGQAPVSMRVTPTVQTHLYRTLARATEDVDRALAAITDSPAFVDETFVPTAGFHAIEVASAFDALRAALIRMGELGAQRIHRMLDERVTGLPSQLAATPGGTGMVVVHKRAVAAAAQLRRTATPATVGLADTSLGQEDAQTFTFAAAAELRRAESLVAEVAACELLCALQAWWLRGIVPPPRLAAILAPARELYVPGPANRPLGDELDGLAALVSHGLTRTTGPG